MDDHYVYVFVRQDLPIPLQLVHACHAVYHMARNFRPDEGIPCLVMIGLPHEKSLAKALRKLRHHQLPHFAWDDPDDKEGILAVATVPLSAAQKLIISEYRLYSLGPASKDAACGLTADEGAKGRLSSEKEHSVFNGEVGGSIPSDGSNTSGMPCS